MPDQIRSKLGAYLDGELDRQNQLEIEAHLETCQTCQSELDDLRHLSCLLQAASQPDFIPVQNFKTQLMLQLPQRVETPQPGSNGLLLLWMAPVLVLVGRIFIQVTSHLITLVFLANQAGFLDGAVTWAALDAKQMHWFMIAQAAIGATLDLGGQIGLNLLNDINLFAQDQIVLLLWQVGVGILYWGVLTVIWHNKDKAEWILPTLGETSLN